MQATWEEKYPGIWHTQFGEPSPFTPHSVLNLVPKTEKMKEMPKVKFPFASAKIRWEQTAGKTILALPLEADEKIYGFGLQFMKMNHRGRTRFLRVNSDPKQDTGETHAPVPFYVSSKGYGVLIHTSRIVTVYCGSTVRKESELNSRVKDRNSDKQWKATPLSDTVEIVVPEAGAEIFVFGGPTMMDAVKRYNLLHGGGVLPPKWGLGFWHRVPRAFTAEEALEEAEQFRQRDFPCDVIGLEPGWHTRSYPVTYEWDRDRFPDPERFVQEMDDKGFKVNLWEHPYVSPEAAIYSQLEPLSGSHTVWYGLAPDYTLPQAQEIYKKQHIEEHAAIGISGYKLDECDGSELTRNSWIFPAHATFPSGWDGEQMRQVYGLLQQKMTADLFRSIGKRTFGLARASMTGASSMPYALYSDLYDHRQFVRALCNAGFSGLLWAPEVRKAKSAEDWVRRIQTACFSPLAMLNAWADGTKPWSFPEVEGIVKKYIQLRMRLIPYLYSLFARYHFEGEPPIRAMQLDHTKAMDVFKSDDNAKQFNSSELAYGVSENKEPDDQFMVGDAMLVAPLFAGQSSREIVLPQGIWYDFETGERFEGGRTIEVEPGLESIPVYVKEGAIIPMMPVLPHVPKKDESVSLEIHHFGSASGKFALFDDDGESFAYEQGQYRWRTLEVLFDEQGKRHSKVSAVEKDWHSAYSSFEWVFHHK